MDSFSLKKPFKNTHKNILRARAVRNRAVGPFLPQPECSRQIPRNSSTQTMPRPHPMGSSRFESSVNRETLKAQLEDQMLTHPELYTDVSQIQF